MSEAAPAPPETELFTLTEVQLLLAEKRTALSALRTGIAIFAFPLSVFSVLIATSKFYQPDKVLQWLIPLLLLTAGLIGLGIYLVVHAFHRIRHYDRLIEEFKRTNPRLAKLIQ